MQRILNSVFIAYSTSFIFLGIAGLLWVAGGHHVQGDISAQGWQLNPGNYPVFATVIVSLLGMAVPLNMGAEVVNRRGASKYLLLGVIITIFGYLFATFGVLAVLPPKDLANPAFITEILSATFGPGIGTVLGILLYSIMVIYFICATAAFNLMFARLLLVAGIDRRLPNAVQRLSRQRTPVNAMLAQTGINILFMLVLFFLAPAFAPANAGISFAVFLVTINAASVIWNIAMIGLFLCGIILFARYARQLTNKWIAPPLIMYAAAVAGCIAAGFAIYSTFFAGSPLPQALNNADWVYWVLLVVLGSLAIGALYSFLVPEAEDLVALIYGNPGEKRVGQSAREMRRPLSGETQNDHTFRGVPADRAGNVSRNLPASTK